MEKINVNLSKLTPEKRCIIESLLRKTGLTDIPEEFTIVRTVNEDVPGYIDFYYIELPDGRKFGRDFEDLDWNWYKVYYATWTDNFTQSPVLTEELYRIPEIIYRVVKGEDMDLQKLNDFGIISDKEIADAVNKLHLYIDVYNLDLKKNIKIPLIVTWFFIEKDKIYVTGIKNEKYLIWDIRRNITKTIDITINGIPAKLCLFEYECIKR